MELEKIELNTTQRRVFDYIERFGSITSIEAITDLGETRLSARIWELRDKGIPLSGRFEKVKNRFGEERNVKRYSIAGVGGNEDGCDTER